MSIKTVNSLSHYTDWTIGHVHSGALGWVAFVSFGAIYCMVPWLWNQPLYSLSWSSWHFWIATIGIVLYITLDVGGRHHAGTDVARLHQSRLPRIFLRRSGSGDASLSTSSARIGGALFLVGALIMVFNLWRTSSGVRCARRRQRVAPAE